VLPLHALRGILEDGALLAKRELLGRTTAAVRGTTSQTDAVLGLGNYVHLYLLRPGSQWEDIPILATQLLNGRGAPFPHVGLETGTGALDDDDCTLCLWNIAIGRPRVDGYYQGGNWTRGTDPAKVLEVWRLFRDRRPDIQMARGYWNDPIQIPILCGDQIASALSLLRRAPRGMPELLLRSPVSIGDHFTLSVFSDDDMEALQTLGDLLQFSGVRIRMYSMEAYKCQSPDTRAWRSRIQSYFAGKVRFPAKLDLIGKGDPGGSEDA
jgi:hypothetical protein